MLFIWVTKQQADNSQTRADAPILNEHVVLPLSNKAYVILITEYLLDNLSEKEEVCRQE